MTFHVWSMELLRLYIFEVSYLERQLSLYICIILNHDYINTAVQIGIISKGVSVNVIDCFVE